MCVCQLCLYGRSHCKQNAQHDGCFLSFFLTGGGVGVGGGRRSDPTHYRQQCPIIVVAGKGTVILTTSCILWNLLYHARASAHARVHSLTAFLRSRFITRAQQFWNLSPQIAVVSLQLTTTSPAWKSGNSASRRS